MRQRRRIEVGDRLRAGLFAVCASVLFAAISGCGLPSIEITTVPDAAGGGAGRTERIAGRVHGAKQRQRIVLFARSGTWWVQPFSRRPFTAIRQDSTWEADIHLGMEYAALVVDATYSPPKTTDVLPGLGGGIMAISRVQGRAPTPLAKLVPKTIRFSGYDWELLQLPTDSGGVSHENRASNVRIDSAGVTPPDCSRGGHMDVQRGNTTAQPGLWDVLLSVQPAATPRARHCAGNVYLG